MLINKLDDERGYCLDIAGGKGANAPFDKGRQAHTCYNDTGNVLEDQGYYENEITGGKFRVVHFDVCMTASTVAEGSSISLAKCNDSKEQKFRLNEKGQILIGDRSKLCLTVSSTEKKEGRGGSPEHVMRPLLLQKCEDGNKAYQAWSI